jgi:hypothetical protein
MKTYKTSVISILTAILVKLAHTLSAQLTDSFDQFLSGQLVSPAQTKEITFTVKNTTHLTENNELRFTDPYISYSTNEFSTDQEDYLDIREEHVLNLEPMFRHEFRQDSGEKYQHLEQGLENGDISCTPIRNFTGPLYMIHYDFCYEKSTKMLTYTVNVYDSRQDPNNKES